MPDDRTYRFNLHLPGLLEVLAGSLYSTPKVGLRELIQNAHDSCVRRKIEAHRNTVSVHALIQASRLASIASGET